MGDRWKRPFETDSDHRKSGVRYDHRDDEWGAWGYWGRNKADDQSGSEEDVSSIQAAPILNLSLKLELPSLPFTPVADPIWSHRSWPGADAERRQ